MFVDRWNENSTFRINSIALSDTLFVAIAERETIANILTMYPTSR